MLFVKKKMVLKMANYATMCTATPLPKTYNKWIKELRHMIIVYKTLIESFHHNNALFSYNIGYVNKTL